MEVAAGTGDARATSADSPAAELDQTKPHVGQRHAGGAAPPSEKARGGRGANCEGSLRVRAVPRAGIGECAERFRRGGRRTRHGIACVHGRRPKPMPLPDTRVGLFWPASARPDVGGSRAIPGLWFIPSGCRGRGAAMSELTPTDFGAFFTHLWGYRPFPWQQRLAERVCGFGWPSCLDLPTASGKTACLDVAVFAMAVKQRGPRRVFFVVDRRVVVDAAFERMQEIAWKLHEAEEGVLKTVGDRLRSLAHSNCPLDTYELRGGIYRDDSWVRSPLQTTLVASTVDQVGSRLLFRGYGVWDKVLPIHAGLVANDSLIILDEAHCSRPFSETLAGKMG